MRAISWQVSAVDYLINGLLHTMRTNPLDDSNLDEAIGFIARLNQIKAHNIGYLGESALEIAADVRAIQPPEGYGRIMVSDHGQLVGLLGKE